MWVMTSFGILMPSVRPDGTVEPGDPRTIQVRARRKRDLEILRDRYMQDTLGPIIYIGNTDYEYRAYCTPEAWAMALVKISYEIDYTKFKPTTESKFGDKALHSLYNRLWGVIFNDLSTEAHRNAYLGVDTWRRPTQKGDTGKTGTLPKTARGFARYDWKNVDWSDDALVEPLIDEFEAALERDGLAHDGEVVRWKSSGRIDHTFCSHGNSKNARRRCQRRNHK